MRGKGWWSVVFAALGVLLALLSLCLLYTSDAADERSSVDLGGRRIIKKKKLTILAAHRIDSMSQPYTDTH